jgi:hypothetical protein
MGKIMPTEKGCFGGIMPILFEIIPNAVLIFDYISIYYQFSPCLNDIGAEFAV